MQYDLSELKRVTLKKIYLKCYNVVPPIPNV